MVKKPSRKIQSVVPAYHEFVLNGLIGIEGTSQSDVVARVVGDWIKSNNDLLVRLQLTVCEWMSDSGLETAKNVVSISPAESDKK